MKIAKSETTAVEVPLERPFLAGGLHMVESVPFVLLKLYTDDGIEGLGYAFSLSRRAFRPLKATIDELSGRVGGRQPPGA